MASEKEKMLTGLLYNAGDSELTAARNHCRTILNRFNHSSPLEFEFRNQLLLELIPLQGEGIWIEPPFYCDYG
jgi:maltose O-acetyltransferase